MDTGYGYGPYGYSQNQGYYPQQGYPMSTPGQGAPPPSYMTRNPQQGPPEDYLMYAIFTTVCCCLPLGLVAVMKSLDVRNRYMAGDLAGAYEAGQSSKRWSLAALITGIAFNVLVPIIVLVIYFTVGLGSLSSFY